MHRKTFREVQEAAEQSVMHSEEVFDEMRALLGYGDFPYDRIESELPCGVAIPTHEQARAYLQTFCPSVRECMRQRAMRMAADFRRYEPLVGATIWDMYVILACFDFDEERIVRYHRTGVYDG